MNPSHGPGRCGPTERDRTAYRLVAGRLPYDLDLAPEAQGRLAAFGCRPAALVPVVEKLAGKA